VGTNKLLQRYALAQVALLLINAFTPNDSWAQTLIRVAGGWGAAACVVVGMRRHRPPGAASYYLFGLGMVMNVAGILVERLLQSLAPSTGAAPTLADLFWLALYPPFVAGMALLIRRRGNGRDASALVDTAIITMGLGLLSWVFLIRPQATHVETTLLARAVLTAYPLGDLVILGLMVRLLLGGGSRGLAFRLMIGAVVALLASDLAWAIAAQLDVDPGPLIRRLLGMNYQLAYGLVGAAALHTSVSELAVTAPRAARLRPGVLVGLALASLIAPALLLFETARGKVVNGAAIAVSSTALFLLVVVRMAQLLRRIEERSRAMRLVLDTINDGLLRVAGDGSVADEHSATIDRWFGRLPSGARFCDFMAPIDGTFAATFRLAHEAWREGMLPAELCLEQFPHRLRAGEREFMVAYLPVVDGGGDGLLLVINDVTERLLRTQQEAEQRELLTIAQELARDRDGLLALFEDVTRQLEQLASGGNDRASDRRRLHTLKGNTALSGLDVIAQLCHAAENELDGDRSLEPGASKSFQSLRARWLMLSETLRDLGGERGPDVVELHKRDLEELGRDLELGLPAARAIERLWSWRCELVARPLARLASHARVLARRLGKGELDVDLQTDELLLDTDRWRPLWAEMVHLVNNAIDHGIETPEERRTAGKPSRPRLRLSAQLRDGSLVIEVEDDGRGIDWEAIKRAAAPLGLPTGTVSELTAALLAAGVSSRAEVSLTSGRGMGMSAVNERTRALQGQLGLASRPGEGTCCRLSFPASALSPHEGPIAPRAASDPARALAEASVRPAIAIDRSE
jgi:HPt (histidine-containing phosphotransfer) domain-containing protein/two-component sensor histidine kinase